MKAYASAASVYVNRPLLRWSMGIVAALGIFAVVMRHDHDKGYTLGAMLMMIGIMGVQVAGYIGMTAVQALWSDRARLMPGMKAAHGPVIVGVLVGVLGFVVGIGILAGEDAWGTLSVTIAIMAVGLWLVVMRRWWMVPAVLYFATLASYGQENHRFRFAMAAAGAAAIAAWMGKLFYVGGEPLDLNADFLIRVDSRLLEIVRRVMEVGPMWVLSRIRWKRPSLMWRLTRWWPGAGDGWMSALLLLWGYVPLFINPKKIDEFFRVAKWPFSVPATMMTGLTAIPLLLGMSMVMTRGSVISMQAVWPVRRKVMLAEHLAIIIAEVAAMWVVAVTPMVVLAARGVEVFDWRMTIICITGSAATLALVMGVLVWLEQRRAMEIRGIMVMLGVYAVGLTVGRWVMEMSTPAIAGCIVLVVVLAVAVWRDAIRRWISADFTRLPNEGKVLNV